MEKIVKFGKYCKFCANFEKTEEESPCACCLEEPVNTDSVRPTKFKKSSKFPEVPYGYFHSKEKIKDYLYETEYRELNYIFADHYYASKQSHFPMGSCSSFRKGRYFARNLDWTYDENAEFFVKVENGARFKSKGIAGGVSGLIEPFVTTDQYSEMYKLVPFQMYDGINDQGVVANMNVVPTDHGFNKSIPMKEKKYEICSLMLIRFILDNFDNATDAVNFIRDYVSVYFTDATHGMHYETHYMIADPRKTYCLEFISNRAVVIDISQRAIMTNFHLYGVLFNPDGSVYTPETQTELLNAMNYNLITANGSGLERYNYINEHYDLMSQKDDFRKALHDIRYTKAYTSAPVVSNPYWYTEFVGNRGLNVASTPEEYAPVVDAAAELYSNRSRTDGGKTWQTVHSVIYDIQTKDMYLITQEDGEEIKL